MKGKKQLYVDRPLITAFPYHADLFAVIQDIPTADRWIMNYMLQLRVNKICVNNMFLDFATGDASNLINNCPFIKLNIAEREGIEDIIGFAVDTIDNDRYIYVSVDRYYISVCDEYLKYHMNHDMLISGYDTEKKVLYVSDFFVNGRYEQKELPFSEFIEAYNNFNKNQYSLYEDVMQFTKRQDFRYRFDADTAIELINEYITAYNSDRRYYPIKDSRFLNEDRYCWGVDIYTQLIKNIGTMKEGRCITPLRSYQILLEHKRLMYKALDFMLGERRLRITGNDIESYREIVKKAERVKMLILKYQASGDERLLDNASDILGLMQKTEREILQKAVNSYRKTKSIYIPRNTNISADSCLPGYFTDRSRRIQGINFKFSGDMLEIVSKHKFDEALQCLIDGEAAVWQSERYEAGQYRYIYKMNQDYYHTVELTEVIDSRVLLRGNIAFNCMSEDTLQNTQRAYAGFVGEDRVTLGKWACGNDGNEAAGSYGSKGYDLFYAVQKPDTVELEYCGFEEKIWSAESCEDAVLTAPPGKKRAAMCRYFYEEAYIECVIAAPEAERISFYVYNRKEYIRDMLFSIRDYENGRELVSHEVVADKPETGVYVTFEVSGRVNIVITNLSKDIAVISGVFFD